MFVTERDLKQLLLDTEQEFKSKNKNYQGIMVFYSGHGDSTHLLLSDYNGSTDGIYERSKLISYFNGRNIRSKATSFKLFFMDSCRGNQLSQVLGVGGVGGGGFHRGNDKLIHPESNRGILFSNPDSYRSYEIPYDILTDDIAWNRLTKENYNNNKNYPQCGILINSIYHIYKDNAIKYKYNINYSTMQDMIKKKAAKEVPIENNFNISWIKVEYSDTLDNTKQKMYFVNK